MPHSAQDPKTQVLITEIGSSLASELANSLISQNCKVFGAGKVPQAQELLKHPNFTLLDINLAQPLPSHLPKFDLIFHLLPESTQSLKTFSHASCLTSATSNIISQARNGVSKVFILAPISTNNQFYEQIAKDETIKKNLRLFLVGDIYGPNESIIHAKLQPHSDSYRSGHFYTHNELTSLVSQAVLSDKVILENEGQTIIYPTYITDAVSAICEFAFTHDSKNTRLIISENPKTALSVAYVIQRVARLSLDKELKLYFSGAKMDIESEPGPVTRMADLGFEPKIELKQGLKEIFEYFKKKDPTIVPPVSPTPTPSQPPTQPPSPTPGLHTSADRRHLTSKIPKFQISINFKRAMLLIAVLLILTVGKAALDIYLATSSLKTAKHSLYSGDFKRAKNKADSAVKSYKAAAVKVKILTLPLSLFSLKKINSINLALTSGAKGADSLSSFVQGTKILAKDLEIITSEKSAKDSIDLETPSADFQKAYFEATYAYELAKLAKEGNIFSNQLEKAQDSFEELSIISSSTFELVNLITDITGASGKKNYLILLQNNTELRPGGGFIGNFGLAEFEDGHLKNISVEDIYTIDGQLKEEIEPPLELSEKLGVKQLFLRDSNWSLDFAVNSATARDFFKKETGKEVDGVIALDLIFVQNLLKQIGTIKLEDYDEEITADNLFARGEYYSEVGFFPGSTQKGDFFGSLTRKLISKIVSSIASTNSANENNLPWLALVSTAREALAEKHLLLSFDNTNLSSFIKTKGWNNPLPPTSFDLANESIGTLDFLALSEANLGANKANRFIDRKIDYQMTIGRDADLVAKLTITYKNNSQADTWPAGTYVNFLRVYTPFAVNLFDFQNGTNSNLEEVEVISQGEFTVFTTFIEVPIKQSRQVSFSYRIPKNIKLEQAPTYYLYVQKQPGTEKDPFNFTFNLPSYIKVESFNSDEQYLGKQNITIETDLKTDRLFQIELAKK